jgi:signal transduction histidine kinase
VPLGDTQPRQASAASPRLAELAKSAPTALLLFSEAGALLAQNDAASAAFGGSSLAGLFGSAARADVLLASVWRHGRVCGEVELITAQGKVWFLLQARATRDPETGRSAVSVSAEDITERRSVERAKDEFISIVNHELRTPLTAIRGAFGLLANDVIEDQPQKAELFEIAWENVLRLGRLVDDLLDVQRLRLGVVDLVLATIELGPLVRETLELLGPIADEAGVVLCVLEPVAVPGLLPVAPPAARVDPGRLVQALSNLVTNAVKHAPPGSSVSVEVIDRGDTVRVSVRDEGPGVPAAFVPHLFAPFAQADSTDTRARGGAGLGLYIVRTLIEAHGGTVGYDPAQGGGATFYFELPLALPSMPPPAPPE